MAEHRDALSIVAGIILFQCASSVLIQKPQNSEAVVNSSVVIVCKSSTSYSVTWEHTPVGTEISKHVFLASAIVPPYGERMKVDVNRETGEYHLNISSVQTADAGKYACIDEAGQGERQVAELTVLESTPQCQENFDRRGLLIDNDCGLEPEMINFQCTLRYAGNNEPKLVWRITGGNPIIPMTTVIDRSQGQIVESVVIKPTLPMDGRSFTCGTSWSNISWTSSNIKLLYVYNNSATHKISEATHLNCSANSSGECSYEWSHRDIIAGVKQSLEIDGDHHGLYVCAANCTIRKNQCIVTAAVVEYNTVGTTDSEIPKMTIVVSIMAVIVTIALVIGGIAALFVKRYAATKRGLLESSSRILSAKSPPCAISLQGIAIVGNDLYTIRKNEPIVNVYSLDDLFKPPREISSQDLKDPRDIAAGNRFLFITDAECNCVWKMTTQRKTKFTEFIKDVQSPFTISISWRGELIMAQNPDKLVIYNSNGVEVKFIRLEEVYEVYHAIQASPGFIAASVAVRTHSEDDEAAGVILVSMASERIVERSLGQNSPVLCKPCHMATNEAGSIFVADADKNQIVILDKCLKPIQEVSFDSSMFLPTRLQYKNGQLIVGQSSGTVQFLGATYLERIKISPSITCDKACERALRENSRLLHTKKQQYEAMV